VVRPQIANHPTHGRRHPATMWLVRRNRRKSVRALDDLLTGMAAPFRFIDRQHFVLGGMQKAALRQFAPLILAVSPGAPVPSRREETD
jgi:hypothetical protein